MRIRVVFDSQFGNTEQLAHAIAASLGREHAVALVPIRDERSAHAIGDADLTFVGGPTQVRGASAVMRSFLDGIPELQGAAIAAFDTRMDAPGIFTGAAAGVIGKRVRRLGGRLVVAPESFLVRGREGPLLDGERERAAAWAVRAVAHVGRGG
jgi:flavodoxin